MSIMGVHVCKYGTHIGFSDHKNANTLHLTSANMLSELTYFRAQS